jgi:predicted RNase H-like HicB family nuclease
LFSTILECRVSYGPVHWVDEPDDSTKIDPMVKTKNIHSYFAVFDPAEEGGYNVSFPDFPGCVTFGRSFEEAQEKGREVLELWLEELAVQRKPIPAETKRPIIHEVEVALPT